MNQRQFIELVFKNGERRIVNKGTILYVVPTPDGVSVNLAGETTPKIVTTPSYGELRCWLLGNKEE